MTLAERTLNEHLWMGTEPSEAQKSIFAAMNDYAKACVEASLRKAAMAAEVTINGKPAMGGYQVDEYSITSPENIVLL